MKLVEVKLKNFRGYRNETSLSFEDLTVIIGRNDAGKSSILDALDIFFNNAKIEEDDASAEGDPEDVRITCVFSELPPQIVLDEQHPTTLQAEYLVRNDGKLEICRIYDCDAAKPKNTKTFARANHPTTAGCTDLLALKIAALKTRATQRNVNLQDVNQTIKTELRRAVWSQTQGLELGLTDVDLTSEAGASAWEQIQLHMPVYALFKSDRTSTDQDDEAQDPMKAAIKETVKRHEADLAAVIAQVRSELEAVAAKTVDKIREMSPALAQSLHPEVTTKNWDSLFSVSLDGSDGVSINKRGSGTRRLVLLNFFRAQAEDTSKGKGTGVIYAIEEPETSQHPNHQLMLLDAFNEIVSHGNAQVIVTTHTPTLARKVERKSLRLIGAEAGHPSVAYGTVDATLEAIKTTLGVLADHDVRVFVGVEGKWDIEFLKVLSRVLHAVDPTIPDLSVVEAAGKLIFIPLGGSSMDLWISRVAQLGRPEIYLTDRDNPPPANPKYNAEMLQWNARVGCHARCTGKKELENYLHPAVIQAVVPTFPNAIGDFDDVPMIYAEYVYNAAVGAGAWAGLSAEDKKSKGSRAKKTLNSICVQAMTHAQLLHADPNGEIADFLRLVGSKL